MVSLLQFLGGKVSTRGGRVILSLVKFVSLVDCSKNSMYGLSAFVFGGEGYNFNVRLEGIFGKMQNA